MKFTLTINLDNEVFGPTPEERDAMLSLKLKQVACDVHQGRYSPDVSRSIYDINGNYIGFSTMVEDRP